MAWRPGLPELLIVLVLVLLLFGPGRIAKIAGELGKGIRSFKDGLTPEDDEDTEQSDESKTEES